MWGLRLGSSARRASVVALNYSFVGFKVSIQINKGTGEEKNMLHLARLFCMFTYIFVRFTSHFSQAI